MIEKKGELGGGTIVSILIVVIVILIVLLGSISLGLIKNPLKDLIPGFDNGNESVENVERVEVEINEFENVVFFIDSNAGGGFYYKYDGVLSWIRSGNKDDFSQGASFTTNPDQSKKNFEFMNSLIGLSFEEGLQKIADRVREDKSNWVLRPKLRVYVGEDELVYKRNDPALKDIRIIIKQINNLQNG